MILSGKRYTRAKYVPATWGLDRARKALNRPIQPDNARCGGTQNDSRHPAEVVGHDVQRKLQRINVAGIPDAHDPMAFWLVCLFLVAIVIAAIVIAAFVITKWKKWI